MVYPINAGIVDLYQSPYWRNMLNSYKDLSPERRRLNRARRTARLLRGKPVLPKRKFKDIPPYERLPGRLLKDTLPRPANHEEAREWLRELAEFISADPNASRRFRFIVMAIKKFIRKGDAGNLHEELRLIPSQHATKRRRGQPKIDIDTEALIVEHFSNGCSKEEICKRLGVKGSRVIRTITKINKLRGIRKHGAQPDGFSREDARKFSTQMPLEHQIKLRAATITLKDVLPEQ